MVSSIYIYTVKIYEKRNYERICFPNCWTFMRGTTELDSSTFLNFKDHRRMKTKDNLSES